MTNETERYCEAHTTPPAPILQALERTTHLTTLRPQMLSGPFQGTFLRLLSHALRPQRAVEVGTFTGYAALCLAEGLAADGVLHTIEVNDELESTIRQYVQAAGFENRICVHIGDAAHILPQLDGPFDLAFIDAGKMDYPAHFELILPKMRTGGIILVDNVLWHGKVVADAPDATTQLLRQFNHDRRHDPRVETLLLPLRDGLLWMRVL